MSAALGIFLASYLVIAGLPLPVLRLDRPSAALLGALGMVAAGIVTPTEAVHDAVNTDTLLLLFGMMVLSIYMAEARLFRVLSWLLLQRIRSPRRLLIAIVFLSGLASALLVNDTVCVMLTPLVLQLTLDARLRPLPYLLALAFGANAGSVATPTGNPQNMLIATVSHIRYLDFSLALLLPATTALSLVALVLFLLFGRDLGRAPIQAHAGERPEVDRPLAAACLVVLGGVLAAFLAGANLGWSAMHGAAVLIVAARRPPRPLLGQVDWLLLLFFAGLFVIIFGVGKAGLAQAMFAHLRVLLGPSVWSQALGFGAFTLIASQLVSNVPFVLLAAHWMSGFRDPHFMWLSTALFSTLAGNLTLIGSVANIIVLESAGEHGRIGFRQFLRYGTLVTLVSTAGAFAVLALERRWGWL